MILGICSFFFSILTGIPAIIFGHLAKTEIRQSRGRLQGDGMALAGLILGYLSVVFIPMILIIAAIAIPNLLRARMAANEASAVGSLRTIVTASVTYSSTYGHGFPPTLAALGSPASGESSGAAHADLIDSTLAAGFKSGYAFTYEAYGDGGKVPAPPPGFILDRGTVDAFRINADPIEPNTTGVRDFYVDQTGVIRYQNDAPANENSPPIQ
jgi:type II secretory pathway pseudopilin PulG